MQTSRQLGGMIRAERRALGMRQVDVANALQVRRQTIADLEAGGNAGVHVLMGVLTVLGKRVSLEDGRFDFEGLDLSKRASRV